METSYIVTFIGEDRPGLVEAVSAVIEQSGGNWHESRLSQLGGKFAGLVLVSLPTNGIDSLNRDFGDTLRFVAVNSPMNFAGDAGSVVPEPGTLLLLCSGLLGMAVLGRRREPH